MKDILYRVLRSLSGTIRLLLGLQFPFGVDGLLRRS